MKRGEPLRRKTPLKRSGFLRRTRIQPKRHPSPKDRYWQQARKMVEARANGRCEARIDGVCLVMGSHAHHIVLRSRGGPDEPHNLAWLCAPCHSWVHDHPTEATRLGLMGPSQT